MEPGWVKSKRLSEVVGLFFGLLEPMQHDSTAVAKYHIAPSSPPDGIQSLITYCI